MEINELTNVKLLETSLTLKKILVSSDYCYHLDLIAIMSLGLHIPLWGTGTAVHLTITSSFRE